MEKSAGGRSEKFFGSQNNVRFFEGIFFAYLGALEEMQLTWSGFEFWLKIYQMLTLESYLQTFSVSRPVLSLRYNYLSQIAKNKALPITPKVLIL